MNIRLSKRIGRIAALAMLVCAMGSVHAAGYLSPSAMVKTNGGKTLLIAQDTGQRLDVFDVATGKVTRTIALPARPRGLAARADGTVAYLAMGEAEGTIALLDLASGKITKTIAVGHGPVAPTLSPDGNRLYVCNRFDNAVGIVDLAAGKQIATVPVAREPIALAITPDGKQLFVANHLPDGRANAEYVASKVSVIDTAAAKLVKTIKLVNGAEGMRGMCISPDGAMVYATHLMARFLVPTTQIERGWINTNAVSLIRVADQKLLFTVLLDDMDQGFANPWAVAISPDNKTLYVSSAGNSELSIIDLPALHKKINAAVAKQGDKADAMHLNAHNDLSMLVGLRQRVQLKGMGPRAIVPLANVVYAAQYFSDSLDKVTLVKGKATEVTSIPLGPTVPLTKVRQGEIFFNDARLCFQKWQSCASCHPDARTDALNWDLLNDGIGNPKNVKSMFMAHTTPPVMALGVRDKAETAVRAGIRYIQFAVRPEADAAAIDAYLKNLPQTPSPYLINGKLSPAATRGKAVFEKSGCIRCHPAPLYTNLQMYDVGTGTGQDKGKAFDVPTFREVWRTSPYMHDGRAVTIEEVIIKHNPKDRRGKTSKLSEKQIKDLAKYVLSL